MVVAQVKTILSVCQLYILVQQSQRKLVRNLKDSLLKLWGMYESEVGETRISGTETETETRGLRNTRPRLRLRLKNLVFRDRY